MKTSFIIHNIFYFIIRTFYGGVLLVAVALNMTLSIELQCDYSQSGLIQWEMMYICRAKGFEIRVANQTITNVNDPAPSVKQNSSTKSKNDVRGVYFMKLTVNFLPIKVFETFPNMKYFGIVDSSLHYLNHGDFNGYNNLNVLDITDNYIKTLNDDIFNGTTNLLKLGLNSNQIRNISKDAFNGLLKLEVLNLSNNRIQSLLNETFHDLTSLKVLNLRSNKLKKLQFGLFKLNQHLEDIDFGHNMLLFVNSELFNNLTNIKYIEFDDNYCIDDYFTSDKLKDIQSKLESLCLESETINTTESDELTFALRADINFLENRLPVLQKQVDLLEKTSNQTKMISKQTLNTIPLTQQLGKEVQSLKESFTKIQNEISEKNRSDFRMQIFWIVIALIIVCIIVGGFIYFRIVKRKKNTIQHMRMRDF